MIKKLYKQFLCVIISLTLLLSGIPAAVFAADTDLSDDIVILYTNDVHTYIDGPLSYDVISAIKNDLKKEYKHVFLADAGDHIQGTAYGSMDKGESIIKLMNASGYDVATPGNHEFDYNMPGFKHVIDLAEFPYISCNFYNKADGIRGTNVLDSFAMFDCGDEKVAFIGITTPETMSKTTPAYFQDEKGSFIYGISGGNDGSELYQDVQNTINSVKSAGATKIIALGHLGTDPASSPWTSEETITATSGIDAFIDGHSHTITENKIVRDKSGSDVILTQTGEYFDRIGMMVIDSETGDITTDFIECTGSTETGLALSSELYKGTSLIYDAEVLVLKNNWLKEIDTRLGQKIGFSSVTFDNYDSDGNRLVRTRETNSGDLAADSLYYLFDDMGLDVDVAIMNGGGIRNQAVTGDITYKTCKDIHPFGNVACLQKITGQQLLDMLEWGARQVGAAEEGSFLHVSGITYKINTSIPNTTKADDMGVWTGGPAEYRVHDVMVYDKETGTWAPLNLNKEYNLAGYNYTLRDLGGGFAMLKGAVNVLDYVMEDYMVLANYISSFKDGIIDAKNSPLLEMYPNFLLDYGNVNGSGRITIIGQDQGNPPQTDNPEDDNSGDNNDNPSPDVTVKYHVIIRGLKDEVDIEVPAGKSVNETWCEEYGVEDYTETLDTEKKGYILEGFFTDEAYHSGEAFDFNTPITSDIVLYPKWAVDDTPDDKPDEPTEDPEDKTYKVSVAKATGGKVTVSTQTAAKGETVIITLEPDSNRVVSNVRVLDNYGHLLTVTKNEDGTYSYIQPGGRVTVRVTFKLKSGSTSGNSNSNSSNSSNNSNSNSSNKNNSSSGNNNSSNPQMGDNSILWLWTTLLMVSSSSLLIVTRLKRRLDETN